MSSSAGSQHRMRRERCSAHVPNEIIAIQEVPRTLSGKKLEVPVKKLFMGVPVEKAVSQDALSNPRSIQYFIAFASHISSKGR